MAEDVKYVLSLTDLLSPKLREANKEANKLEQSMGGVSTILGAIGAAAATAGVGLFVQSMVQAGSKVEDARVGLTTLLKDGAEAGKVIEQTMQDATKTPFAFEGLLAANKALIGAGETAEGSRAAVLNLANAIAATGGGDDELQRMVVNLQQIRNTGKATALDIKQFAYAGINVYQVLADATGKPIEKVKDMEVSYDMLTMALKKAHDQGGIYANGLENMAGNTSVQISNLGDALFQLKVKMFDDLKPAIDAVVSSGKGFIEVMRESWDWLTQNNEVVISFGAALGTLALGVIAYNGYLAIMSIATAWQTTLTFLQMVATDGLALALYAAGVTGAAAWALMTMGLSLVVAGVVLAYQKSEGFRNGVTLLADDAMIAGNALKLMWEAATGDTEAYKETSARIDQLLAERQAIMDGTYHGNQDHFGETVTGGVPFSMLTNYNAAGGKGGAKAKGGAGPSTDIAPAKAQPNKAVTINISIGKLIETFKIQTSNLKESTGEIGEHVTNTLLAAVNQASMKSDL